ncbi:ATP-binding protein [Desulfobacterales bacterium HSG17]|nr:ATP-binding protein [Desulfobacterales bacterium HSG17]
MTKTNGASSRSESKRTETERVFRVSAEGLYESEQADTRTFAGTIGIATDDTERKQTENRQKLAFQVLELLNQSDEKCDVIRSILLLIKEFTGFEAVGIRLKDGDDYPYYETFGFSKDFVEKEQYLCTRDQTGELVRDLEGMSCLECMCGNIIRGRTDPNLPFFSKGGSFWTNSTTELLGSTTEKDRQARTRNLCNTEGYESVALIPLHSGKEIIGLLQLNDRQRDKLNPEMIRYFEGMGASIGISLKRKSIQNALQNSARQWESTFDAISDSICILDTEGKILRCNKAMTELAGKPFREIIGKRYWDLLYRTPETIEGKPFKYMTNIHQRESLVLPVNGKWLSIIADPLTDETGNCMGTVHIISDITEVRKLETRLRQSQKMEAIGTLAGGIAHDFNNILFPIIGYTEMSMDDLPEHSSVRKNLKEILHASLRAKDLVQQILSFSCQKDQEYKTFKVQYIIKEALKLLRSSIPATIEIIEKIDKNCNKILGDPSQIHQIIMNLCTNAYHAMEDTGGRLEVSLNERDIKSADFTGNIHLKPGRYLQLTISDTGNGIRHDLLERIFEPYFTTKKDGKGTGLGLSVVHGIVTNHRGDISVSSDPGKGSVFHIYLPVIDSFPEKVETGFPETVMHGKENILLVDDEEQNIRMVHLMLENMGYKVTSQTLAMQALEVFRSHSNQFDLVLTDMTMPHMTGLDLAGEIIQIRPDIPIILFTGFSEYINEEIIKKAGIREFFLTPVAKRDLAKTLRKVLDHG